MNQTDLIQNVLSTEHQARRLTEDARTQSENMEASIQQEIQVMEQRYAENAEEYLRRFEARQREKSGVRLRELDDRREAKLRQVEDIYAARRDQWVDAIFQRIVGKAGE